MTTNLTAPQAPVTDEELDQMIWKLERDGMTPKMLSLMRELREVRRAKKLNQPVSETNDSGWIPVSERMPDEIGRYWCYVEEQNSLGKPHYQWNCSWNGERWWVESENGGRVTHWMELPAAPKEVG